MRELRRWFAEHVAVDPQPGGAFRFWGRHTYGPAGEPDARQRITTWDPDRALSFEWVFDGRHSEVAVALSPAADGNLASTAVTVEHRFPTAPPDTDLVDDLWRLTMGNLDAHLRGGNGIVLPDYADPNPEIRMSIVIDAPPDRVFDALINPEALNHWIASTAAVEPRVGGRYTYGWQYKVGDRDVAGGPTRILELVPNKRLVTDWPDWRGDPAKPPTRVAWLLEPVGDKTRVTIVHGTFPRTADISDYPFGWGSFLEALKGFVQK